jgi:hypothetical protein
MLKGGFRLGVGMCGVCWGKKEKGREGGLRDGRWWGDWKSYWEHKLGYYWRDRGENGNVRGCVVLCGTCGAEYREAGGSSPVGRGSIFVFLLVSECWCGGGGWVCRGPYSFEKGSVEWKCKMVVKWV